jgi:hypothetical protein
MSSDNDVDVSTAMLRLQERLQNMEGIFFSFTEEELRQRPAPGKWSRLEILGHLVDSALNNLKRFTEIQFSPQPYTLVPYPQDALVAANQYQELPVQHVLALWKILNQQIYYVVEKIPPGMLTTPVRTQYEGNDPGTLGWLIADYVAHLEHHLKQVETK